MDLRSLMQQIQEGDREAFSTLYHRYNKIVLRIVLDEVKDVEAAKQIIKAVFSEAYNTIRQKGPYMGDLNGWFDALADKHIRHFKENGLKAAQEAQDAQKRQYSLEEARAIEEKVDARISDGEEKAQGSKNRGEIISFAGLCAFAVLLLWVLIGLLSKLEILPSIDIGYTWFNRVAFKLF